MDNSNLKKFFLARIMDASLMHGASSSISGEDLRRLKIWNSILLIGILPNPVVAFLLFQSNSTICGVLTLVHIGVLLTAYLQTRLSQLLEMQLSLIWSSTWIFMQSVLLKADLGIEYVLCSIGFLPVAVIPMEGRKLQAILSLYPIFLACIIFLLPTSGIGLYEISAFHAYLIKCICFLTFVLLSSAMVWIFVMETFRIQKNFLESQKQLANSMRLNDIAKLAAGFAHEINNPAAIVSGTNEVIRKLITKEDHPINEKVLQRLKSSDRAILRITNIVKSLRQMSIGGSSKQVGYCLWKDIQNDLQNLIHFCTFLSYFEP